MKKLILSAFFLMCAFSIYAQRTVSNALYERLFAAAQRYESEGQWFYALNAWYDCIESDIDGSSEAWNRYERLKARVEAGDSTVWNGLEADAGRYWSDHFSTVFTETAAGFRKTGTEQNTMEYVVQYEVSPTARYQELSALMQKGSGKSAEDTWNMYDCVLQLSVVHEDGTLLFVGTPQIAGGRYVFTGLPVPFIKLISQQKAYVQAAVVAVRSEEGTLVKVQDGARYCLVSRYRPEVAEREYVLKTPLAERMTAARIPAAPPVPEPVRVQPPVMSQTPVTQEPVFKEPVVEQVVEQVVAPMVVPTVEVPVEPAAEVADEPPAGEELPGDVPPGDVQAVSEDQTADEDPPVIDEPPASDVQAGAAGEEPETASEPKAPLLEPAAEKESSVAQYLKQRDVEIQKKLDETPQRTVQMLYAGISHDLRPRFGTYVSAPVLGNVFIGLQAGIGVKKLDFSVDALARVGLMQNLGIMTVSVFGIAGIYEYPVLSVHVGKAPAMLGAGVSGEIGLLKTVAGVSVWAGYSLDGRLATNISLSAGVKLE